MNDPKRTDRPVIQPTQATATKPSLTSEKEITPHRPVKPLDIKKFLFVRYAQPWSLELRPGDEVRVHNKIDGPVRLLFTSASAFVETAPYEIPANSQETFRARSGDGAKGRYEYEIDLYPFKVKPDSWFVLLCRKVAMFFFALMTRQKGGGSNPEMIIE